MAWAAWVNGFWEKLKERLVIRGLVAVTVSEVQFIRITKPWLPLPSSSYVKSRLCGYPLHSGELTSLLRFCRRKLAKRCTFIATVAYLNGSIPMTISWPNILPSHVHVHLPTTPASWRKKAEPRRRATSPHNRCTNHRLTNNDTQTGNFSGSEGWNSVDFYGWCGLFFLGSMGVTRDVWKGIR